MKLSEQHQQKKHQSSNDRSFPKQIRLLLFLSCFTFVLTGCWDRVEINDLAITLGTAVDLTDDGEYRGTIFIPVPSMLGGGGGIEGGENVFYLQGNTGKTIAEAVDQAQQRTARQLTFAHRRVFIIGEELAREGMQGMLDIMSRVPDNRLTSHLIIAQGQASDLLRSDPGLETFVTEVIRELVIAPNRIRLNAQFVSEALLQTGADPIIAYIGVHEDEDPHAEIEKPEQEADKVPIFLGYAQLKGDKMVDSFTQDAANGLLLLMQTRPQFSVKIQELDQSDVNIRIINGHTRIRTSLNDGIPVYHVNVSAIGQIWESYSKNDFVNDQEIEYLEEQINQQIKQFIEQAIEQMQEHQTDSAALGMHLMHRYPRLWRTNYEQTWSEWIPQLQFEIEVDSQIKRMGLHTRNIYREEHPEDD